MERSKILSNNHPVLESFVLRSSMARKCPGVAKQVASVGQTIPLINMMMSCAHANLVMRVMLVSSLLQQPLLTMKLNHQMTVILLVPHLVTTRKEVFFLLLTILGKVSVCTRSRHHLFIHLGAPVLDTHQRPYCHQRNHCLLTRKSCYFHVGRTAHFIYTYM